MNTCHAAVVSAIPKGIEISWDSALSTIETFVAERIKPGENPLSGSAPRRQERVRANER